MRKGERVCARECERGWDKEFCRSGFKKGFTFNLVLAEKVQNEDGDNTLEVRGRQASKVD